MSGEAGAWATLLPSPAKKVSYHGHVKLLSW